MDFDINLPAVKKDDKLTEQINKKMFSDDGDKSKMLSKVLIFIKMNQPVSITELQNKMIEYYKVDMDRSNVFRAAQKLQKLGILNQTVSGVVLAMSESERDAIHNHIIAKHRQFLERIPQAFKARYNDVNYFWVANGDGVKYIEWCCKILGFEVKQK